MQRGAVNGPKQIRSVGGEGVGPRDSKRMFCDEALDLVESIADGELTPEGRVAAHLATCPNCAAALDSARRLEQALRARPVPRAPARFTARTMTMLRRRRWRSEQFLDVGFNVALGPWRWWSSLA